MRGIAIGDWGVIGLGIFNSQAIWMILEVTEWWDGRASQVLKFHDDILILLMMMIINIITMYVPTHSFRDTYVDVVQMAHQVMAI